MLRLFRVSGFKAQDVGFRACGLGFGSLASHLFFASTAKPASESPLIVAIVLLRLRLSSSLAL